MKHFFQSFAGTLTAIVLLALIAGGVGACVTRDKPDVQTHSWLVVELYGDLLEYDPPGGVLSAVSGGDPTLQSVLDNLAKARVDERIEGVILKTNAGAALGMAQMEEIQNAIDRLRAADKRVLAWAESFEVPQYYLLSACDAIYVPPSAYIGFKGVASGSMHVKKAMDKLGIHADIHKIKDYKAAAELVTRTDMSEPARENDRWLLEDLSETFTRTLAERRGIDRKQIDLLMQHALFTAEEAKEYGLVDEVKYWDELTAELKRDEDDQLRETPSGEYAKVTMDDVGLDGKRKIAVVHAQGIIAGRESSANPLFGVTMGHETIVAELRRARFDEDIEAVILRVDSSGGEALASDLMGHEVELTASVKPVVVSMVDVAASGGYHISYRASRILADRTTVTGSIGSISGKFNLAGLYDKLGITFDAVTIGPNALMDSDLHDYTPEQRERFEAEHWARFNAWLTDVAEHRGMSFEEAERLAHGRVWTGSQAADNGLVDELGDLHRAIEVAKELADIDADEQVSVLHYPERKGLVASLLGGKEKAAVGTAARWLIHRELRKELTQTRVLLEQHGISAIDFHR